MQTEQIDAAEKALAKEFSDYLASVSREVIAPSSANIPRHQADVEKKLAKVAEARSGVESEFGRQREYLDSVREQIDGIIKESELKIARLHSSSQSLLENARQRIVAELATISEQAGNTARQIGEENKKTSVAIGDHHQALRRLTEEHREAVTQIFDEAKVALSHTFESHRTNLNAAASELLRRFEVIAEDVKQTTGKLGTVHEETRVRLFTEFSEFKESIRAQIESCHDALRRDVSGQIDGKSEDVIKQVGSGITGHYSAQFSSLETEIRNGMGKLGDSSKGQGERLNAAIISAFADAARLVTECQAASVTQIQKELSLVKKLMIGMIVVVAVIVAAGFTFRL